MVGEVFLFSTFIFGVIGVGTFDETYLSDNQLIISFVKEKHI